MIKPDFTKPSHLLIGASAVIGLVLLLPNLGKGLEAVKYVLGIAPAAYAGEAMANAVRSDFDKDIAERREERKLEQQRQDLQAQYNQQLLKLQQQQQSNQATPPGIPVVPDIPAIPEAEVTGLLAPLWSERDANGVCWVCQAMRYEDCWTMDSWEHGEDCE